MGRVSQYLERRALQAAIPVEREAPSFPKGQGSGQSTKPGAGEGHAGGGRGPLGLQGTDAGLLLPRHPAHYL